MIKSLVIHPVLAVGLGASVGARAMNYDDDIIAEGASSAASQADEATGFHWQNNKLLDTLRAIENSSAGRRLTPGDRSLEMLREARAGGMYGHSPAGS
jgi:hypothetical protein